MLRPKAPVDHPRTNKLTSTLVLAAATAALTAASAWAAPPSYQVLIRYQAHGCHAWSLAGDACKAKQFLHTAPGTQLTFIDTDVMPHTLVQLAGPKATPTTPFMHKLGADSTVQLFAKGRYVFSTKAGEDNVLKLVVVVR